MGKLQFEIAIFISKLTHFLYWNLSILKTKIWGKSNKKILLSNFKLLNWKENLTQGLRHTKYIFEFKNFDSSILQYYNCIVPITIDDLIFVDKHRDLISDNPIPIPSKDSIQFCDDKFIFNSELSRKGYNKLIPQMGVLGKYPYILKKKIDVSGQNSFIISDKNEEDEKMELINNTSEYFTQELISGKYEYATHILVKNGRIIKSLNIQYAFDKDFPIKGKDKHLYTKICRCPYLETFLAILNLIEFEGICCVNYKVRNNIPMIIEINPRVGYSLSKYLFSFIDEVL